MDNLMPLIKKNGYSVAGFAKVVLNMTYKTFNYNLKNKAFKYDQLKLITEALKCKFEDL